VSRTLWWILVFAAAIASYFCVSRLVLPSDNRPSPLGATEDPDKPVVGSSSVAAPSRARLQVVNAVDNSLIIGAQLSYRVISGVERGPRIEVQSPSGLFDIDVSESATSIWVDAWGPRMAKTTCMQVIPEQGQDIIVKTWPIRRLIVSCMTTEGVALSGVGVRLSRVPSVQDPGCGVMQDPVELVVTGKAVELDLAAGVYEYSAIRNGFSPTEGWHEVDPLEPEPLAIRLEPVPPVLVGRVIVGWSGEPAVGARVSVNGRFWSGMADEKGAFVVNETPGQVASPIATVVVQPPLDRPELAGVTVCYPWRTVGLTIPLGGKKLLLALRGDAIGSARVSWSHMEQVPPKVAKWHPLGPRPDGIMPIPEDQGDFRSHWLRAQFPNSAPMYTQLHLLPYSDVADGRIFEWVVQRDALLVEVVDQELSPLRDVEVDVVYAPWSSGVAALRLRETADYDPSLETPFTASECGLIDQGRTNQHGVCALGAVLGAGYVVRCRRQGYCPAAYPIAGSRALRIRMVRAGGISGRIEGYESGALRLVSEGGQESSRARPLDIAVKPSGEFQAEAVPTGGYIAFLIGRSRSVGAMGTTFTYWWKDLGLVEVAAHDSYVVLHVPRTNLESVEPVGDVLPGDELLFRHDLTGVHDALTIERANNHLWLRPGTYSVARVRRVNGVPMLSFMSESLLVSGRGSEFPSQVQLDFSGLGSVRLLHSEGVPARGVFRISDWPAQVSSIWIAADEDGWLNVNVPRSGLVLENVAVEGPSGIMPPIEWRVSAGDMGGGVCPALR
jgi:hypothetical protein